MCFILAIRIVIEGLLGHVPTALVALDLDDALNICDKLNRRLGLDREAWTAMAANPVAVSPDVSRSLLGWAAATAFHRAPGARPHRGEGTPAITVGTRPVLPPCSAARAVT